MGRVYFISPTPAMSYYASLCDNQKKVTWEHKRHFGGVPNNTFPLCFNPKQGVWLRVVVYDARNEEVAYFEKESTKVQKVEEIFKRCVE